jgi:O-antigen/teichoic acid export membrane protein
MTSGFRAATNVASSWLKLAVQLAVGVVVSPFIVHRLGDAAFGIWVLVFSVTSYFGLLDFGVRASIGRYVARYAALGDLDQLRRFVNTSLAACSILGAGVLLITLAGSEYLGIFFKIPPGDLGAARLLFVLIGADVALAFPLSIFGCVLEGYQNFWPLNVVQIVAALVRGGLSVLVLGLGGGLVAVAAVTVGVNLLRHFACAALAFRTTPLRLGAQYLDRSVVGQLAGYSATAFMIFIAETLRFQTDAVVVGAFLSAAAVTYFAIGSKLVDYASSIVVSMSQIFTPMASHHDASGDQEKVRRVFLAGNRACALVIFPLCAVLILLGKPAIELWMGAKYLVSYPILVLLILPRTLLLAQSGSIRILLGLGRQRTFALMTMLDGLANLLLSIALVKPWGILGVAWGTAIPLACTSLLFLPRHVCRMLHVPLRTFLLQAYQVPLALTIPMACVLWVLRLWLPVPGYGGLLLEAGVAGLVYCAGLAWWILPASSGAKGRRARFSELWSHALGKEL